MKKFSFIAVILVSILVDHAAAFSRFDKPKQWATPRGNSAANRSVTAISASPLEVIEPSYNLAVGSLALGAAFGLAGALGFGDLFARAGVGTAGPALAQPGRALAHPPERPP